MIHPPQKKNILKSCLTQSETKCQCKDLCELFSLSPKGGSCRFTEMWSPQGALAKSEHTSPHFSLPGAEGGFRHVDTRSETPIWETCFWNFPHSQLGSCFGRGQSCVSWSPAGFVKQVSPAWKQSPGRERPAPGSVWAAAGSRGSFSELHKTLCLLPGRPYSGLHKSLRN